MDLSFACTQASPLSAPTTGPQADIGKYFSPKVGSVLSGDTLTSPADPLLDDFAVFSVPNQEILVWLAPVRPLRAFLDSYTNKPGFLPVVHIMPPGPSQDHIGTTLGVIVRVSSVIVEKSF